MASAHMPSDNAFRKAARSCLRVHDYVDVRPYVPVEFRNDANEGGERGAFVTVHVWVPEWATHNAEETE